jgi:hypothetical protein
VINDEPTHETEISIPWSLRIFKCLSEILQMKMIVFSPSEDFALGQGGP